MSLTRYSYRHAISGFFELPTENARQILPSHLEPVEIHHGTSVFAVTTFDFTESEVGPYGEVVMAIMVAPLLKPGERLPRSAFYPFLVGTTTREAREHAIERWHLPHWMDDVLVVFSQDGAVMGAQVSTGGVPVAELTVSEHSWADVSHLYQSFMNDASGAYMAQVVMEGSQSEHEEETGRLRLHEHPFNRALPLSEISDVPFREMWMRDGIQTFAPLIRLGTA